MITSRAARHCSIATVPLVVAKINRLPATTSGVYSTGEFPWWNPSTIFPCRSPPIIEPAPNCLCSSRAASTEGAGIISCAPLANAETIVVVARKTSTTTTTVSSSGSAAAGSKATSKRVVEAGTEVCFLQDDRGATNCVSFLTPLMYLV